MRFVQKGMIMCDSGATTVSKPITLQDKEITENGTYTADEGFDGLGTVNVNVESSGGNNEDLEQWINFIERGSNQYVTKLPNGLTKIGMYAFQEDSRITIEEIPEGVTTIDYYAFAQCAVKVMTFPNSLEEIGFRAFQKCTSLKEITFKGKPNKIDSTAFDSCTSIAKINVPWAEGEVANAPWGATNAVINYNYTGE